MAAVLAQGPNLREPVKHPFGGRAPVSENLSSAMQSDWDVQHYQFRADFHLDDAEVRVKSVIRVQSRSTQPGALLLHSNGPKLGDIWVGNKKAGVTQQGQQLWVEMPAMEAGEEIELTLNYTSDIGEGQGLGVHWDGETLFSFHEPQGARLWLVTFDDPADKATLDWFVEVDGNLVVAANGEMVERRGLDDGRVEWHFSFDELIPTYLMVVHASEYVVLEDEMLNGDPIRHYIQPGTANDAWVAFETTPEILDTFSDHFGEYPWASYGNAVAPFGGAMEHTTMTTFGSGLLGSSWGEIVNAHEIAHHWFGDYVTLSDWPEIWLNEGFASYSEVLWYEEYYGENGRRQYIDSQVDSYFNWQEYEGISSVYDPNYLFGGAVYDKGSIVLDMLRSLTGDTVFFEALQTYVDRYAHGNATTSDLIEVFDEATGESLQWFFDQWVYRAGDPSLAIGVTEREVEPGMFQLDVLLSQRTDDLWSLPVTLRWQQGGETVNEEVWLDASEQVYTFCLDGSSSSHLVDPDGLLLLQARETQAGPALPVSCVESVEEPEEEDPEGTVFPYGEGGASLEVGGCHTTPTRKTRAPWMGLVALMLWRRRRVSLEGEARRSA